MKKILRIFMIVLMLSTISVSSVSVSAAVKNGIKTEKGKKYYYKKGKKVKNKLGYKIGKYYYTIDKTGVIKKVNKTTGLAGIYAEKYSRNLYKSFMAVSKMKYRSLGNKSNAYLANYGFEKGYGDCNVQALCFFYVAKALGYKDVKYVKGYVLRENNKYGAHAWVTIGTEDALRVYDPSLGQYYYNNAPASERTAKMKLAYNFQYGDKGTYKYCDAQKNELGVIEEPETEAPTESEEETP